MIKILKERKMTQDMADFCNQFAGVSKDDYTVHKNGKEQSKPTESLDMFLARTCTTDMVTRIKAEHGGGQIIIKVYIKNNIEFLWIMVSPIISRDKLKITDIRF